MGTYTKFGGLLRLLQHTRISMARIASLLLSTAATFRAQELDKPLAPPLAPEPVPSTIGIDSMELVWPRGDDTTVAYPTEYFEIQQRVFGDTGATSIDGDAVWTTAAGGGRVGAPQDPRREGQHEVQVISVRVDRGQKVDSGFFQLAFSFGGVHYQERFTDGAHATNQTAAITAPIPWDASAAVVKQALEALETVQRVQVGFVLGVAQDLFSPFPLID